jgi:hypothetical protein
VVYAAGYPELKNSGYGFSHIHCIQMHNWIFIYIRPTLVLTTYLVTTCEITPPIYNPVGG